MIFSFAVICIFIFTRRFMKYDDKTSQATGVGSAGPVKVLLKNCPKVLLRGSRVGKCYFGHEIESASKKC